VRFSCIRTTTQSIGGNAPSPGAVPVVAAFSDAFASGLAFGALTDLRLLAPARAPRGERILDRAICFPGFLGPVKPSRSCTPQATLPAAAPLSSGDARGPVRIPHAQVPRNAARLSAVT
jgi:hypothetical protein